MIRVHWKISGGPNDYSIESLPIHSILGGNDSRVISIKFWSLAIISACKCKSIVVQHLFKFPGWQDNYFLPLFLISNGQSTGLSKDELHFTVYSDFLSCSLHVYIEHLGWHVCQPISLGDTPTDPILQDSLISNDKVCKSRKPCKRICPSGGVYYHTREREQGLSSLLPSFSFEACQKHEMIFLEWCPPLKFPVHSQTWLKVPS